MKKKLEVEQEIIKITLLINKEYPELSKYISEMPPNNSESDEVTIETLEKYYHSLEELIANYAKTHQGKIIQKEHLTSEYQGYPLYPPSEDIYQKSKEESDVDPEDISKKKSSIKNPKGRNEKGFQEDMSGDDLDVPGSELDDQQESVGSEDEENNYYSLGGDNHDDLEEDKE
ncbi:MAG: hypothetical protein ACJAT1_002080 [Marivirga sp.]|jgi:hypothetical protein